MTHTHFVTTRLAAAIERAEEKGRWVQARLDGLRLPALNQDDKSFEKRARIAAGCLHMAIEHSQAMVLLLSRGLPGSALALQRLLLEAFVRGVWILRAASDESVDKAGEDNFPNDFGLLVRDIEAAGVFLPGMLSALKADHWKRLCSFTHTGFQQIGARYTASGLGQNYEDDELINALTFANGISAMTVMEFAGLAGEESIAHEALAQMKT